MRLIYCAGPYSSPDIDTRNENIQRADETGRQLLALGYAVIVPHTMTAGWELDQRFPTDKQFYEQDLEILSRCDAMCVIGNWQESKGTLGEIRCAEENGIPVFFNVSSVPPPDELDVNIPEQVIADQRARRAFGIGEYGRPVIAHNGRNALQDAYEELLDAAVYIKQAIAEQD